MGLSLYGTIALWDYRCVGVSLCGTNVLNTAAFRPRQSSCSSLSSACVHTNPHNSVCVHTNPHNSGCVHTDPHNSGCEHTNPHNSGCEHTDPHNSGCEHTNPHNSGCAHTNHHNSVCTQTHTTLSVRTQTYTTLAVSTQTHTTLAVCTQTTQLWLSEVTCHPHCACRWSSKWSSRQGRVGASVQVKRVKFYSSSWLFTCSLKLDGVFLYNL